MPHVAILNVELVSRTVMLTTNPSDYALNILEINLRHHAPELFGEKSRGPIHPLFFFKNHIEVYT